jgi:hypothetical protein
VSTDLLRVAVPKLGEESTPVSSNPVVTRCCDAGTRAYRSVFAKKNNAFDASAAASEAFRLAMPPLTGTENIRDFIACVAHGMIIGAIRSGDGARLLYAAQVAAGLQKSLLAKAKPGAA